LLALVCLTVVHRLQPQWLAVSVAQAAASEQISAQRVSRLCSRALPQLEETIAAATRMGRPVNGRSEPDLALQLAIALALRCQTAIYVNRDIFNRASHEDPTDHQSAEDLRKKLRDIDPTDFGKFPLE